MKGPVEFGSVKKVTNASHFFPKIFKKYLRFQSSHTNYGLFHKTYPHLKVIVNDINEIWSLELAYVNKLAKYNRGVHHLLVTVNFLSHFLQVEPLKTKYAKKNAKAFKKLIKSKQSKKIGLTKVRLIVLDFMSNDWIKLTARLARLHFHVLIPETF